jgi:mRNA interferase MazF
MKKYSFGNIVLLSFPLANYTGNKKRPALVILDTGDDDFLAARITTQLSRGKHDYEISNWKESGLLKPSVIRLDKIATIEKSLIFKKLGNLKEIEILEVKRIFKMICESIEN